MNVCGQALSRWGGWRKTRKKGKETVVNRFLPFVFVYFVVFCCLVSAVTYSPTTSRLQYHQRVQA